MLKKEILRKEQEKCIYAYEWTPNNVLCCVGQVQQL